MCILWHTEGSNITHVCTLFKVKRLVPELVLLLLVVPNFHGIHDWRSILTSNINNISPCFTTEVGVGNLHNLLIETQILHTSRLTQWNNGQIVHDKSNSPVAVRSSLYHKLGIHRGANPCFSSVCLYLASWNTSTEAVSLGKKMNIKIDPQLFLVTFGIVSWPVRQKFSPNKILNVYDKSTELWWHRWGKSENGDARLNFHSKLDILDHTLTWSIIIFHVFFGPYVSSLVSGAHYQPNTAFQ